MLDVLIYIRSFLNMSLFFFSECKKEDRQEYIHGDEKYLESYTFSFFFLSFLFHSLTLVFQLGFSQH